MNKFITNVLGPVALVVQVMLLIDLGSDLYAKYKAKKAEKNNIVLRSLSSRRRRLCGRFNNRPRSYREHS